MLEEEDEIGYTQALIVNLPPIVSAVSEYQNIQIYQSDHYGRVFVLDDCLQLTERDAPHYNEMLAHVPVMEYLARLSDGNKDGDLRVPMRVLVVGGGDGYVVSELLKYPQVGSIDHVELDEGVINVAKQHLPWAEAWDDERVNLVVGDGAAFVKQQAEKGRSYHIVVQDASDPFWLHEDGTVMTLPSSVLYDTSHFERLYDLLRPTDGALMMQAETYNIPSNLESIRKWRKLLHDIGFEKPRYGSISIGTYSTGQIGFFAAHARDAMDEEKVCKSGYGCAEKSGDSFVYDTMDTMPEMDWSRVITQFNDLKGTSYYHPRIHRSSFDLPMWVEESIYGNDGADIKAPTGVNA